MRGGTFGWEYPPGVSGNEPQIAGYPRCARCSHEAEAHGDEDFDPNDSSCQEEGCECPEYDQFGEE